MNIWDDDRPAHERVAIAKRLSEIFERYCPTAIQFDGRLDHWPAFAHGCVTRAHYALGSVLALADREFDAEVLVRVLYEHVVTLAWIAINPVDHLPRYVGYEAGQRRAMFVEFHGLKEGTPAPPEIQEKAFRSLGRWLTFHKSVVGSRPDLKLQATRADAHWSQHYASFGENVLAHFYTNVYRTYSTRVHPTILGARYFVSGKAPEILVSTTPRARGSKSVEIAPYLFACGLLVCGHCFGWPPKEEVYAAFAAKSDDGGERDPGGH